MGVADNGSTSVQNISLSDLIDESRAIVALLMLKVTFQEQFVREARSFRGGRDDLSRQSPIEPSLKKGAQGARGIAGIMPYQRSIGSVNA